MRPSSPRVLIGLALVVGAVVVLPMILPLSRVYMLIDVLIFSLFAVSYNILLGYGGLLSFGHSAYFGLGAYAVALILRHFPAVPLPIAVILGVGAAALGGVIIGNFCVRRGGPYFAMLTLAFGLMLYTVAWKWRALTFGDDGFGGFVPRSVEAFGVELLMTADIRQMYYVIAVIVGLCLFVTWLVMTRTPFGNAVVSVKQNAERASFLGYNVYVTKLLAYTFAAALAGLAGSLFVTFRDFVSPSVMDLALSTDVVLMTFIGGMYSFFGPVLGAAFVVIAGDYLATVTARWEMIMGLTFVLMVLYAPGGFMGFVERGSAWLASGRGGVQRLRLPRRTAASAHESRSESG